MPVKKKVKSKLSAADRIKAWRSNPTDENLAKLLSGAALRSDVQQEFDKENTKSQKTKTKIYVPKEEDSDDGVTYMIPSDTEGQSSSEFRREDKGVHNLRSKKRTVIFVPLEEEYESVDSQDETTTDSDDMLEEPDVYQKGSVTKGRGRAHKDSF